MVNDKIIPGNKLRTLLVEYDKYIQEANIQNKYATGWKPVCIEEFYMNEFQVIQDGNY